MPAQGFGDAPRTTTMLCTACDVTWRGNELDACWSCSENSTVAEAKPRKVRHPSPVTVEAERLVG